jgi:hypothetical protein
MVMYDGLGLTMAWQKGTRERYMWKNLVLGKEKSFHIGKSLDELNQRKSSTENCRYELCIYFICMVKLFYDQLGNFM